MHLAFVIRSPKDPLPSLEKCGVYRLQCPDCPALYTGEMENFAGEQLCNISNANRNSIEGRAYPLRFRYREKALSIFLNASMLMKLFLSRVISKVWNPTTSCSLTRWNILFGKSVEMIHCTARKYCAKIETSLSVLVFNSANYSQKLRVFYWQRCSRKM